MLHKHPQIDLIAVYTQPDRAAGRGRQEQISAVKQAAKALSIPILQPISLNNTSDIERFRAHRADLLVVAAYGLLLPLAIIEQPLLALNVHASLLPRWRGAAPIQRAIMANDRQTGISMMRIVEALDAGPVLRQQSCTIDDTDTAGTLHDKLTILGANCLQATLDDFLAGKLVEAPQNDADTSYAAKITARDRPLDWHYDADVLARQVRGLNPIPVATAHFGTLKLKIWSAVPMPAETTSVPGTIVVTGSAGIDVATGNGLLRITQLQPEGKRPMSAADFVNGFQHLLPAS